MKILYDASVLGYGHLQSISKTGVARVIENIAYGLVKSKKCEVYFCDSLSLLTLKALLDYQQSSTAFKAIPVLHSSQIMLIINKIKELYSLFNIAETAQLPNDLKQEVKRLIEIIDKAICGSYMCSFEIEDLKLVDLFHATFYQVPDVVRQSNKTVFITIYDLIPILYPDFFTNTNEADRNFKTISSIQESDWIFCISEATKIDLCNISKNVDPSKVLVVYPAADDKMFYPCRNTTKLEFTKRKYNIPQGQYVMALSTLEPRKNFDHIIRCFSKLIQDSKVKDLYLVIVGGVGWDIKNIVNEMTKSSIAKNQIIFTGRVDDIDLAPLYSGATAFVYPSLYEGFGLPPLEAMKCGVPVITSNNSSLPEVVGDAGIMLSPTDEDGLCDSLLKIYQDHNLFTTLSLKSLQQAQKFSWEYCVQQTIAGYELAMSC